ncbi:NAD-dependent deacylase [Pseudobacteriovorax antillogorgiicola]|uniref:NAD-dependent protein deacylase n=1 Tax=Pseudobacteriovorax antillogorgiicola TaxID=1513793 RepID=A0A1Y6BZ33_9BACT|nr:NAD-dependent deacylase [Pseudobacteriovorax antillogorgiicola]TCS51229.1 NAD-dependent deacetylase [Pseudobacteriovorax antillogorgiicola]SMF36903.1 NAD-dependent deacetylase [Pseudobacteriovorax antillogorgiicola]
MYHNIVVLTGAGISAESGIKTFRDADGLWENHPIEEVASPEGFAANPSLVYDFYNQRRRQLLDPAIEPNAAHVALADLEADTQVTIITQNVDNLHERAGSSRVWHMHGELMKAKCRSSGRSLEISTDFDEKTVCTCCQKTGTLRPDIVWFGEIPYYLDQIQDILARCDLFVSIGTSGQVYPAAGFVRALEPKVPKIEINTDATAISHSFNRHFVGPASTAVQEFIQVLKSDQL